MNINGTEYTIGADPEIFVKDGGARKKIPIP